MRALWLKEVRYHGTVAVGIGRDRDRPELEVRFGGEPRMLARAELALLEEGEALVHIEPWQVLGEEVNPRV